MKRLVLLGEGHGEVGALPILTRRILNEKSSEHVLVVENDMIRAHGTSGIVKWDKKKQRGDFGEWRRYVSLAGRKSRQGCVLAVIDGDAKSFPAGSGSRFCATTAARTLAMEAEEVGAGKIFSLAVVFACAEYETWLIAGVESFVGKKFEDGRPALPADVKLPQGEHEAHGKRWLEDNFLGYRPTRVQAALTRMLDLQVVRSKRLRSFRRLEHAIEQLLEASQKGVHISSPG